MQRNLSIQTAKKSVRRQHLVAGDDGFTIIELMIALSVLSVILVASTVIMIQIGALYSKGINQANLQNDTRNVSQDVTSGLQFSGNIFQAGGPTTETIGTQTVQVSSYCVGTTRYSYVTGHELGTDNATGFTTPHVLWRDTMKNSNYPCNPLDITNSDPNTNTNDPNYASSNLDGYEMLGSHMTLQALNISPVNNGSTATYNVSVWTSFGDSDLVSPATFPGTYPSCRPIKGDQFCAISEINSSATERVIQSN